MAAAKEKTIPPAKLRFMNLRNAFPKTASRKKISSACLAPGENRPASRAASGVWSRRRQSCVGVICYADHLGSPRAITRPSDNAVVWRWDATDPFGGNGPNQNPSGLGDFPFNLRHPGQYADAETGTFQNWNRDYDPGLGGYLQADPLGATLGRRSSAAIKRKLSSMDLKLNNLYMYVDSNPLSSIDPEGLQGLTLGGRLIGGAIGGGARGAAGGFIGAGIGAGIGMALSTCEATPRERCERGCDRDYDLDQKLCETWWKTTGRNPSAYQSCMRRAEEKYVACYQDCGKNNGD